MADLDALRYAGFGSKFIAYDTETIENAPFEAFLTLMIRDIKTEIEIAKSSVEPADKDDEVAQAVLELLGVVELLKTHLEFTLEVMQSNSKKEVEAIKEKYPEIKDLYEKVKSKEDFAPLTIKTALATFHDKLLLVLDQVLRRCFKKEGNAGLKLLGEEDDYAMVKILTGRFRVAALHYPITATIDRNDIINQPRDSKIWQETYKSADLRHLLSKQEAATSFKLLYLASNLSHIIVRNAVKSKGVSSYRAILSLMREILYYGTRHTKAQIQALLCLIDPQAEEAFRAWNMIDNPIASKVIQARLPYLGFDKVIYIPRMFPQITKEVILREYKEGTINKIDPKIAASIHAPPVTNRCKVLKELLREREDKIPVRILSHDYLGIEKCGPTTVKGLFQKTMSFLMGACNKRGRAQKLDGAVIIHMHGGGFVAMSSASMRIYTARWCKNLKMVHFSIDHRLAPKNPYPDALDDIWQTYLWIINYSESVLGIKAKKVIFAGDSSGANLAMAITLRIIHSGLQPPHGCLLVYPCLKVDLMHSTPSLFSAIDNPMLHMSLLKLCIEAYITEGMDGKKDPYISPEVASDELLEKMPPLTLFMRKNFL